MALFRWVWIRNDLALNCEHRSTSLWGGNKCTGQSARGPLISKSVGHHLARGPGHGAAYSVDAMVGSAYSVPGRLSCLCSRSARSFSMSQPADCHPAQKRGERPRPDLQCACLLTFPRRRRYPAAHDQDRESADQWTGRAPRRQGRHSQALLPCEPRRNRATPRRLRHSAQLCPQAQDPREPHAPRVRLRGATIKAASRRRHVAPCEGASQEGGGVATPGSR